MLYILRRGRRPNGGLHYVEIKTVLFCHLILELITTLLGWSCSVWSAIRKPKLHDVAGEI